MISIIGGEISFKGYQKLQTAKKVVFQSEKNKAIEYSGEYTTLDKFYQESYDFEEFVEESFKYLSSFEEVVFVTIGQPIHNNVVSYICKNTKDVEIFGVSSTINSGMINGFDCSSKMMSINAYDFLDWDLNTNQCNYIYEIDNEYLLGDIKAKLSDYYNNDCKIVYNEKLITVNKIPLEVPCDILLPKLDTLEKLRYNYDDLMDIVYNLRKECPWDREQNHKSIRFNLIEEACEMLEAIDKEDIDLLIEEMGDVLLQICLHTVFETEHGDVLKDDVTTGVSQKMIRRHPHVYGEVFVDNSGQVKQNWDAIKKQEYGYKSVSDELKHVSEIMPSLMRCYKVLKKANKKNILLNGDITNIIEEINQEIDVKNNCGRLMILVVDFIKKQNIEAYTLLNDFVSEFIKEIEIIENDDDNSMDFISIEAKSLKIG